MSTHATETAVDGLWPLEQALVFAVDGECLVSIVHLPAAAPALAAAQRAANISTTGVVVVVGGPQYRAGSHRQFVHLARHLASEGYPVLRFDARGMGDSTGSQRDFEHIGDDIGAAIDALMTHLPEVRRVVLCGLCDGAASALLYLDGRADARVQGLCLLNPWVRSEASHARTQVKHYYGQRLMQREFWLKLLRGQVAGAALRSLWTSLRAGGGSFDNDADEPSFQTRMARTWQRFGGHILLALSGNDYTAREFSEVVAAHPAWVGALDKKNIQVHAADAADHTFSSNADSRALERATAAWLQQYFVAATDSARHAGAQHG